MGDALGTSAAGMMIEVGLVSTDPEPLVAFYCGALGFTPTVSFTAAAGTVRKFRAGQAGLKIFVPLGEAQPNPVEPLGQREGVAYFALGVDDAEAAFRRVVEAGATAVLEPVSHRPGAVAAMVRDPGGNLIELLEDRGPAGPG